MKLNKNDNVSVK